MSKNTLNFLVLFGIILLTALGRLLVHPFNFTPVIAIIIFSTYFFKNPILKFVLPLGVIFTSDLFLEITKGIGFYEGSNLIYGSYLVIALFSFLFLKKASILSVGFISIFSSVIFYLISNFAYFYPESYPSNPSIGTYSHDISGILTSYQAGLPFFKNMLAGDLFYTFFLFAIALLIQKREILSPSPTSK